MIFCNLLFKHVFLNTGTCTILSLGTWYKTLQGGRSGWRHRDTCSAPLHNHRKNYNQISKLINTHNHQRTELYGSLTTKDLKKTHSSSRVGEAEFERWGGEVVWLRKAAGAERSGGIPWEQVIPSPSQAAQPWVPALGSSPGKIDPP